jgi:hypothetical protein
METKYSTITTIITVCLIILTLGVITTMDNNTSHNLYEGLILLACLAIFTVSVIMRESVNQAKNF